MAVVDIKRVLRYPPEIFMGTVIKDLDEGYNDLVTYTGLDVAKVHATFMGFSCTPASNVLLEVTKDGIGGYMTVFDLGAVPGLDYHNDARIPAARSIVIRARAISSISNFAFRYLIRASKLRIVHKLLHGIALTPEERRIAERLGLIDSVFAYPSDIWNPYKGITEVHYTAVTVSQSGAILRVTPREGEKAVLIGILVERPSSPNALYIHVDRDGLDDIMVLDAYALPTIHVGYPTPFWNAMRVIAIDELVVRAEVLSGGPYKVRIVYGRAPIFLAEKIAWGLELSEQERIKAERLGLFDQVEAGVVP